MTSDEIVTFIQNNDVRICRRDHGYWSAEIPNSTWVSNATFVEAVEDLARIQSMTHEKKLELMLEIAQAEKVLLAEHRRIYG